MFEFSLSFEAGVELLRTTGGTASMILEQVTTAIGQDDCNVTPTIQPSRADQTLLAQVAQISATWIRRSAGHGR
jgi:hypothetical protein